MGKKELLKLSFVFIIGGIIAIGICVAPILSFPDNVESLNWAIARTLLSVITIPIVVVGFYFTIIQLRKAMAKPSIKVAFSEDGDQQATLSYQNGNNSGLPALYLINKGNAISRYFQVDFIIPEDIGKQSQYEAITKDNSKYIITNTNDGKYTLFVNRPHQDANMHLSPSIDFTKVYESGKESFEIEYRIYGDWAETQKGKLKILVNKQEVTPHASTQS